MCKQAKIGIQTALLLSLLLTASSLWARERDRPDSWGYYRDPGLDLTLAHPASWTVRPREAVPDVIGQLLTITRPDDGGAPCSIAIGQDLNEIGDETLLEWAIDRQRTDTEAWGERPDELLAPAPAFVIASTTEAVRAYGTDFERVLLRRGRLVWFVHAISGEMDGRCGTVLQRMARNLRFGADSPASVADLVRLSASEATPESQAAGGGQANGAPEKLASSWYSPVNKDANNHAWPILCGSTLHTHGSSYAADVQAIYGTSVYAAKAGTVITVGNMTTGFGKYVVIQSGSYYHYYAHLSGILSYIKVGYEVSRYGLRLGYVGNTGLGRPGHEGAHLHFHIQDGALHNSSNGVSLVGMTGFTSNSLYPAGSGICGSMGR